MSEPDRGAGSALALGLVGAVVAATVGAAAVVPPLVARHRALTAADAAALAGADVALGAAAGVPCERAGAVAAASGATVAECRQRGVVVRVRVVVATPFGPVGADAVAGPPPAGPPE